MKVYNDAGILEKIVKDKRKELGASPEEGTDNMGSPKLKLSMSDSFLWVFNKTSEICFFKNERKGYIVVLITFTWKFSYFCSLCILVPYTCMFFTIISLCRKEWHVS